MKNFRVTFDITVGYTMDVEAESREQAREIARKKMYQEPYYYANHHSHVVDYDVVDVEEEED